MPYAELLTIGTELLLGYTVDTNAATLGRELAAAGIALRRRSTVTDEPADIADAARESLRRTPLLVTTGGLGPTSDDITKKVIAELFGRDLYFDDAVWEYVLERFRRFGRVPTRSNRSQAEVPVGATVLVNQWGTAPGLWLEGLLPGEEALGPRTVIMLPGVPREMRNLLRHEVMPRLGGGQTVIRSRLLRTTGIPESTLGELLGAVEAALAPLTLAYLPGVEGVDLRLTAWNLPAAEAERLLDAGVTRVRAAAGAHLYGDDRAELASVVVRDLENRSATLSVAESCTGGLLGARLTDVPGASAVFLGGVIAYDNRIKVELLGVEPAVIEEHGAVSEAVAGAMAEGACRHLGSDLAAAITGVAGPDGGSEAKPVGTIWIAVAGRGNTVVRRFVFGGDRGEIRARAVQAALWMLLGDRS